jgi:hypothetical protein
METDKERNRRLYPDFYTAAARFGRDTVSASITDADGEMVMAHNIDPREYQLVWVDAESLLRTRATLDQHYAGMKPAPKSWVKHIAKKNAGLTQ